MYTITSISVDTPMELNTGDHVFLFRGFPLKFRACNNPNRTDCLSGVFNVKEVGAMPPKKILTEFLSLWSFASDVPVIDRGVIESGTLFKTAADALAANITINHVPYFAKNTIQDTIIFIAETTSEEESYLLRLYGKALNCIDVHSKLFWFWHALVYPSANDNDAKTYIENFVNFIPERYEYLSKEIDFLVNHPKKRSTNLWASLTREDFATNLHQNIRHAIAHIVRAPGRGPSLDIDNPDETAFLGSIANILKKIARYRIENEFSVKKHSSDMNFFRIESSPPHQY